MWQFIQRNYENGSAMTQKEIIKWSVHLETTKKHSRTLCDSHIEESRRIAVEGSLIDNECSFYMKLL